MLNVYQETVKTLKGMNASRDVIYFVSQNAFELQSMHDMGKTLEDIVQYCISETNKH